MADESLDSFLIELDNVEIIEGEGEAQRYFEHARTLKSTILFLRNNPSMGSMAVDLLRCESLLNLDKNTCTRLLKKNYELLVSMAPLSYEVKTVSCEDLPHFGPVIPQINSIWFKIFLYSVSNSGPTSLLISRGTLLSELPKELQDCDKYLVTSWGNDPGVIPSANALFTLNDALSHSAVFVQAYGVCGESSLVVVPFPFTDKKSQDNKSKQISKDFTKWAKHPAIVKLSRIIDLESNCGYITMMNIAGRGSRSKVNQPKSENFIVEKDIPSSKLENVSEEPGGTEDDEVSEEEYQLVSRSNSNPPKNGFTNYECAKIYQEELENELCDFENSNTVDPTKSLTQVQEPQGFDARQQKLESLRLDLKFGELSMSDKIEDKRHCHSTEKSKSDSLRFDDWTVLDCYFGIPLFDAEVNQVTCERIMNNGLWEPASLEQLVKSNAELANQLAKFIDTYQTPSSWNEDTPLPSKSFFCNNGRIKDFNP